jgi:hypothetical protein
MNISSLEHFKQKLKVRHSPKPKQDIIVKIHDESEDVVTVKKSTKNKDVEKDDEEEGEGEGEGEGEEEVDEEKEEEVDEGEPRLSKKSKITIIDQSATSNIDRELILTRIRELKKPKKIEESMEESVKNIEKSFITEQEQEPKTQPTKIIIKKKVKIMSAIPEESSTKITIPSKKPKAAPKIKIVSKIPIKELMIDDPKILARLPPLEKSVHRTSNYYMTNRKLAITKLQQLFEPERKEFMENIKTVSCDSDATQDFDLLPHQKIAREYLNLYTPYRGLLLYFSLGSGKSCTSIAIAEGMKTNKRIYVMTPASLKMNFFTELKKCGDRLFKKDQYWEFVSTIGHPDYITMLSNALSLPKEQVEKQNGAWLVDVRKPSNFAQLSGNDQKIIDNQLNSMIRSKYIDLNYNGMNMRKLRELTDDFTTNPFDHSVVVIDEAHNFVSRIVNKIKRKGTISYMMYDYLMKATDCRIVLLTGTPIINYPNEIGILYNLLRGYIKTWIFHLNVKSSQKVNRDAILEMLDKGGMRTFDYVEYSGNKLTVTRNPFGFINSHKPGRATGKKGGNVTKKTHNKNNISHTKTKKNHNIPTIISVNTENLIQTDNIENTAYTTEIDQLAEGRRVSGLDYDKLPGVNGGEGVVFDKYAGVRLDNTGNISDIEFEKSIIRILSQNGIDIMVDATETKLYKALPDDSDAFLNMFIDKDSVAIKNKKLFQRRILGLTSYYRSAQEQLLPNFVEVEPEEGENDITANPILHIMSSEMSEYQFENYSKIRKEERDKDKKSKKNAKSVKPGVEDVYKISSTYRIFSRACCNFAFPNPPGRPMPDRKGDKDISEAVLDNYEDEEDDEDDKNTDEEEEPKKYADRIQYALQFLQDNADEYLSNEGLKTYSPKFLQILENLTDTDNIGLHLIYSQFRTIEGIGILKLILENNGFEQLRVTQKTDSGEGNEWVLVPPEDPTKPRFLLYTGTETPEERELLRNIYNSQWNVLPPAMSAQLREMAPNNFMGEIVKIMMITSSGAEGINLKNTRFVHIVEPYWHMVRLEQVIGRARRICSHQDLEESLRTVKVFLYLSTFSDEQRTSDKNKELIINDISKLDKKTPLTTDESLYETARIKDTINQQLLKSMKESAIDCSTYSSTNSSENLVCYGYGKVTSNDFGSFPSLEEDQQQKDDLNIRSEKLKLTKVTIGNVDYAVDRSTNVVYDLESYQRSKKTGENLLTVGKLEKIKGRLTIVPIV